ncbi:hypothetical protein H0X09_03975 [Candidatus Saccharibacteria bacterium]|nr:hypothetical protein [Candidatus Saccharibacteria bacterium]
MELLPSSGDNYDIESSVTPENENKNENKYEVLTTPELRAEYLRLTDGLICQMVDKGTDVAIFLDKSARPVAWMVNELWDVLAPSRDLSGEPLKKPEIKFLNIDREQWGAILGRSEDEVGGINVDNLPPKRLEELRDLYAPIKGHSDKEDQSLLSGKNVMVVDEVRVSGDTAEMAHKILAKAFPDAKHISKAYWMDGGVKGNDRTGVRTNTQLPVWYSDRETTGRLVGNRDTSRSGASNSSRQRTGKYWLSAPFREPDLKGRQLKREVYQLAEDLRNHKLLYMPSGSWEPIEPVDDRIERINGIGIEQYIDLRRKSSSIGELVTNYTTLIK